MATRRRARRNSIAGNLNDAQKRIKYLETRAAPRKIASKAVATKNFALRSVEEEIVADNAITRRAIASNAVGTNQIEQDAIVNNLIASNSVTADKIENSAVGTTEIANDSINNDKLATDSVNSDSILGGSVGNTELAGDIADSKISGMSSSKLIDDIQDDQINSISSSKISGVLDDFNIPDLDTSKITSGVFSIDRVPEITEDLVPNLDASKFTTGVFDEFVIPDLDTSKFTSGIFSESRIPELTEDLIPNLPASKFTSGTFDIDTIPVVDSADIPNLPASKITSGTFNINRIPTIDASKISSLSYGTIVDGGLSVAFPLSKQLLTGSQPAAGSTRLTLLVSSQGFYVAAGNHVHGQDGYSNVSSTGVGSHTHPVSIAQSPFFNPLGGNGTHGGHTSGNSGSHQHQTPGFDGTTGSNTSTLRLKKDISDYKIPNIKNLLNLKLKRYKYKNQVRNLQESINREWMYGYIAEEVEELGFREIVGYDENGEPSSLNYGLLSTLIIELVKEQQTEIDLIREKIKRQRKKYDKLSS